jgi:hypothetical protein
MGRTFWTTLGRWASVTLLVWCAEPPAHGQTRATSADVTGIVRDQSDAVVPGARVTAINLDTNIAREVTTDLTGRFDVQAIPPGPYRVEVGLAGFQTQVLERLEVTLGSLASLEVVLRVAGVEEQVTVTASAPGTESAQPVVATVISRDQIASLPINGRDFIAFSLLAPAVTADRMPLQGASATSGLSFAGQRARANNVTVDGLDNNDETVGAVRATFSQEAVREFQVLGQTASAEFGKASGGIVNIVTRSGTNAPSATLFAFGRDDTLNAREHFERFDPGGRPLDQAKAPFRRTQVGATAGGPIRRDRTFAFASFERLRATANNFVTIDDVTPIDVFGQPVGTAVDVLGRAGFPVRTGHVPYELRSSQGLIRLDHHISPTSSLTFRYNFAHDANENTEGWGGIIDRSRAGVLRNTDHMLALSHTAILSSRAVNELRVQMATRDQALTALDPACTGPCDGENEGGPTIEVSGIAAAGRHRLTPQLRNNRRYQVLDTLSVQAGDHLWKTGIDVNVIDHRTGTLPLHFGGRYIFAPLPAIPGLLPQPVSAIEALALGLPAAYVQGYGNSATSSVASDVSAFVQDEWRIHPELTLQAGVRYQRQFWWRHLYDVPGYGQYRIPPDRNNVAPRTGVTWRPARLPDTSFSAAYGVYYDNVVSGVVSVADHINGSAGAVRTLVLRFPQSVTAWNAPGRRLSESATGAFPSLVIAIDPDLETSYTHQVSLGVEHRLFGNTAVAVHLLHARGHKQIGTIDYNPLVPALGPGRRPEDVDGVPGTSASVLQYTSYARTWYRGLTASVRTRRADAYQLMASYVLSKSEDDSSDFQSAFVPQDNGFGRNPDDPDGPPLGFDPTAERGPSLQDQRHRFVLSGSYLAPGGVRIAGTASVSSGVPYTVLAGVDLNGDGDGGGFPSDRARRVPGDPASALPRNTGRLPAEATVDLRVSRVFGVGATRVEPIVEVFNLFDRVNYTDVNNVFGTGRHPDEPLPTFGQFQRAAPPRQVQLALRVTF